MELSSLLSIVGCILSPDRGLVEILGQDVSRLTPAQRVTLRRDQLRFAFQKHHLIRGLTAAETVCVPMKLRGTAKNAALRRAMDLLDAVGLASKANTHPRNMSAGQCQRVALARALANDPELILADEPTAALDAANGQEVMTLLRRLVTEQGKTTIVVTHDQRIFHFADRIVWLENGRVAETCEPVAPPFPTRRASRPSLRLGGRHDQIPRIACSEAGSAWKRGQAYASYYDGRRGARVGAGCGVKAAGEATTVRNRSRADRRVMGSMPAPRPAVTRTGDKRQLTTVATRVSMCIDTENNRPSIFRLSKTLAPIL